MCAIILELFSFMLFYASTRKFYANILKYFLVMYFSDLFRSLRVVLDMKKWSLIGWKDRSTKGSKVMLSDRVAFSRKGGSDYIAGSRKSKDGWSRQQPSSKVLQSRGLPYGRYLLGEPTSIARIAWTEII